MGFISCDHDYNCGSITVRPYQAGTYIRGTIVTIILGECTIGTETSRSNAEIFVDGIDLGKGGHFGVGMGVRVVSRGIRARDSGGTLRQLASTP